MANARDERRLVIDPPTRLPEQGRGRVLRAAPPVVIVFQVVLYPTVAVREHSACGNPPVEAALGIAQLSAAIPPPRAAVDCAPASTGNARKFCK